MATSEFGKAFAAARKEMGPGKTFTFKGKKYTTDMASDKKSSSAPKKAAAPKERPSSGSSTMTTPKPRSGNPRAGNRAGVKISTSGSSTMTTPKPPRGNPRGGNRAGVKMK